MRNGTNELRSPTPRVASRRWVHRLHHLPFGLAMRDEGILARSIMRLCTCYGMRNEEGGGEGKNFVGQWPHPRKAIGARRSQDNKGMRCTERKPEARIRRYHNKPCRENERIDTYKEKKKKNKKRFNKLQISSIRLMIFYLIIFN